MTDHDPRTIPPAIHDAAADWIERIQRESDDRARAALQEWLGQSEDHRRAYYQAQAIWDDSAPLGERFDIRARKIGKAPMLMRQSTHLAAAALGLVALVSMAGIAVLHNGSPISLVSPAVASTYTTTIGEIRTLSLPDDVRLTLDTNTAIEIDPTGRERRILVRRGRVRIATSDAPGPFVVIAGQGMIEPERESTIDVDAMERPAVVIAVKGSARLRNITGSSITVDRVLTAGQPLLIDTGQKVARLARSTAAWPSGLLELDRTPLVEAVATINRYNRTQIVIVDRSVATSTISGGFRVCDVEGFARSVAAMFHLSLDRSEGRIVLRVLSQRRANPAK